MPLFDHAQRWLRAVFALEPGQRGLHGVRGFHALEQDNAAIPESVAELLAEAFLEGARVQYVLGEIFALAGDEAAARPRWQTAADGYDRYPHADAAFVYAARRRLGLGAEEERRAVLESVLESWNNRLVSGTQFPGANAAGQAYFLQALGRDAEARDKLREALLMPDRMMSHYLSRAALAASGAPGDTSR